MENNNFEEVKCPENKGEHFYRHYEEWDGEHWIAQEQCTSCEHAIDSRFFNGCKRAYNKEHDYVFSSNVDAQGIKYITKFCTNCNQSHTYPSQIKGIKWKSKK